MSITKRIAFGAAANWLSRVVAIIVGLVLMPVLFRHLPKEELGVWLLLGQSWATMGILDLGFTPTLTRRIALAKGKSGSDPNVPLNEETLYEIARLVATGRFIYRILAAVSFLVAFGSGFLYLKSLNLHTLSLPTVWIAWGILCASQGINVWGNIWDCLLQGVGYVGWDAILGSSVTTLVLVAQIITLACGGGLVSLAVVAAIGAFAQRYVLRSFSRRKRAELFALRGDLDLALVRSMIPTALLSWTTSLGTVLLMSTDQYFIPGTGGVKLIPAYRAAYLLVYNLSSVSTAMAGASAVFISHLWQSMAFGEIHRVVSRNLRFGLGIMAVGGAYIFVLGHCLIDVWLGPGNFIGYPCLILFFALLFLDAQSFIISTSSRATEEEAYAVCSLTGGVIKLLLAWLLGMRYGVVGIAASTFLAQLATNHWYMVYRGMRRLRMSLGVHFMEVLLPVGCLFVIVLLINSSVISLSLLPPGMPSLIFAAVVSGIILCLYGYVYVLEPNQRTRIARWTSGRLAGQQGSGS